MKTQLALIACLIAGASQLNATIIDLGPNGPSYQRTYVVEQSAISGSFDLRFNSNVRLFQGTYSDFAIQLILQTNSGDVRFATGTGFILNANGNQMCGLRPLGSAAATGELYIGLFPLYSDANGSLATDLTRPFDFYGVHFNLALPDGTTIESAQMSLIASDFIREDGQRTSPFRIGVPDSGATIWLLAVGLVPMLWKGRCVGREI